MRVKLFILLLLLALPAFGQITLSGGVHVSGGVSLVSAACKIDTNSIPPPGTLGVLYPPFQILTNNCVQPVALTIIAGSLPGGLLMAPDGTITGTPTTSGNSSFTVHAMDANNHEAVFLEALTIDVPTATGIAAMPDSALLNWCTDVSCTPSPGALVTVCSSGCSFLTTQLSTAVASLNCGDTLRIQNTTISISGSLSFVKFCDLAHWITITRDFTDTTFPAEGFRVTPCYAGVAAIPGLPAYPCPAPTRHMPYIQKTSQAAAINVLGTGYRFVGIEWGRNNSYDLDFGILNMSNNGVCTAADVACMNAQPTNNIFDRNYIHGDIQRQTNRAIGLGGTRWVGVIDSWIDRVQLSFAGGSGDAQPFGWGNGTFITNSGFGKFHNNFESASTMGNLFCGSFTQPLSASTNFDGVPHDAWFKLDWFYKDELWDTQVGQTQQSNVNVEGTNYGPVPDQTLSIVPAAATYAAVTPTTLSAAIPATAAGGVGQNSITLTSTANFVIGQGIRIEGASRTNTTYYAGLVTNIVGSVVSINPNVVAQTIVPAGAVVSPAWLLLDLLDNDSAGGINRATALTLSTACTQTDCGLLSNSFTNVGSGVHNSQNQLVPMYTPPATVPSGTVAATISYTAVDSRCNTSNNIPPCTQLGKSRTLTATALFTIVASSPAHQFFIGPQNNKLQPSSPDGAMSSVDGNGQGFHYCLQYYALENFASASTTWKVDGVIGGSTTIGTIDTNGLYCSPAATGTHAIDAVASDGTNTNIPVTITSSAPIRSFDYRAFTSKNGFELKCGDRVLVEQCLIENAWGSQGNGNGQGGQLALIHPFNQNGCPSNCADGNGVQQGYGPYHINDFTMRYVKGLNMGAGIVVGGSQQTEGIRRVTMHDVFCINCSYFKNSHGFNLNTYFAMQYNGGSSTVYNWESLDNPMTQDISARHFTFVGDVPSSLPSGGTFGISQGATALMSLRYTLQDSIFPSNTASTFNDPNGGATCDTASGATTGNTEAKALVPCIKNYVFNHLALLDSKACSGTNTPVTGCNYNVFLSSPIWQPTTSDPSLFININAGDYRVVPGGVYDAGGARQASDGTALGGDAAGMTVYENQILSGVRQPLTITTSTLANCHVGVACTQTLTATGGLAPYTWTVPAATSLASRAEDFLTYGAMQLPDRNTFHLNGTAVKYHHVDAGYLEWEKGANGHPWDLEGIDAKNVYQVSTEGDSGDNATCIAAGFPNCFNDPNANKTYINPPPLWPRYHQPGADDVIYTPGPNKYIQTANCGADHQTPIDNLGIRGELTGPFTDVLWKTTFGGDIPDHTPYWLARKWTKCTANNILNCTTEEDYWLVKNWGQVEWCPKTLSGGVYVPAGSCSVNTTKVVGGPGTLNYGCGVPRLPFSGMLPQGTSLTTAPSFNLVDSTGDLTGTAIATGTTTFAAQVSDAAGNIVTKTLTLTVVP